MGDIRYKMNTYTQLIDKHKGENCFIYGAGPSLYHHMQSKFFKSLYKYGIVIVVNSAIIAEKEPSFWISCDHLATNWTWWEDVKKSKCIKLVRSSWLKYKDNQDGFFYFKPRPTSEDLISPEDEGLCYCCSVSSSIDFSLQMGCKKIFVLGLDHKSIDGKHHFWQFFDRKKQPRQLRPAQAKWEVQKSVFPIHMKAYEALEKFSQYKKSKIYNCNPESKVNCFERIKMEDVKKILGVK